MAEDRRWQRWQAKCGAEGGDERRSAVVAVRRRMPPRRQPTMEARGYGRNYRQVRREMKRLVDEGGAVCWRCRRWINPAEPWHAGHRDDVPGAKVRGLYAGPEHASCSFISGGWKRHGVLHPPMPPRRTRPRPKALDFFDPKPIYSQPITDDADA